MRYRITNEDEYNMIDDFIFHILTIGDSVDISSLKLLLIYLSDLIEEYDKKYYNIIQ